MPDRLILISGGVILSLGFIKGAITQKPLTPVVEGGLVAILLLSLLDSFGGSWEKFASSLAVVAMLAVIYSDLPTVLDFFNNAQKSVPTGGTLTERNPQYPGHTNPQ